MENTIAGPYPRLHQSAADGPDGLRRTYDIPYSAGSAQELATLNRSREKRVLRRHIQMGAQSLGDIWRQELDLPEFLSTSQPITLEEQIAIFCGRKRWISLTNRDKG